MNNQELGRLLCYVLRHNPQSIGLDLDEKGYADITELIACVNKKHSNLLDIVKLRELVANDEKNRYAFHEDSLKIRANQGHSIPVDVELLATKPPEILYHGTATKFLHSILEQGLIPKTRLYVHLSQDTITAKKVGERHGEPVVFQVNALDLYHEQCEFFLSANGVWLTKFVPKEFIKVLPL